MIDPENYNRAVGWLKRNSETYANSPQDNFQRDGLLHSFEVLYNVTEMTLREALNELTGDASVLQLSSRELMRHATDEDVFLTSAREWLEYGIAIERANESLGKAMAPIILPILPRYIQDLENFSKRLAKRLATHV